MTRWRGELFGLGLDSEVAIAGCPPGPVSSEAPRVRLQVAARSELTERLRSDAEVLEWNPLPSGRRVPALLFDPTAGYLEPAPGAGIFHVSPDGRTVAVAPNRVAPWRWQRHLIGRVLPFAATLAGLEPFHASAVAGPAGSVLFTGESGLGKSTLAALLLLAGWQLLTDDVLTVSVRDGAAYGHPGAGLLWLRGPTVRTLGPAGVRRLGPLAGRSREGWRVAVPTVAEPVPVRALYVLEPAEPGAPVGLHPAPSALAARLLAASFNAVLLEPARLARQLDACAALAAGAPVATLRMGLGADPRVAAAAVLEDLGAQGLSA